jgi:hypothetical protein
VDNRCASTPRLTLRGGPFGATQPPGIGVVAPQWHAARKQVVCRPVRVVSWSDTEVTVLLPHTAVGGVAGFADVAYIAAYDAWVDRENSRVRAALDAAACAGTAPPPDLVIRHPWSDCPPPVPAATYAAGGPKLVVEIVPANGVVARWRKHVPRLSPGESFWLTWSSANATTVHRSEPAPGGVLAAAGHPAKGDVAPSGSILLTAPPGPRAVRLTFVATNACGAVMATLDAVVIAPPLVAPAVIAVAPIPGGDIDVLNTGGGETLQPDGRSIPLVAGKRTVIRVDWQLAVPIAPPGEEVIVTSSVWAKVPSYPSGPVTTELRAQSDTSQPPPAPTAPRLEMRPTAIFTTNRQMFNFVLPASLAAGEVTLTAYITARSPGTGEGGDDLYYHYSASATVRFHHRRTIRFRYERWSSATSPAPSDAECTAALQADGALLPVPDPPISALFAAPRTSNTLVEDLFALKSNTPGAAGKEEIWFTMGTWGVGGVALSSTPWVAASELTRCVSAHEVAHMFKQAHIDDPNCGPDDGESPATFPDGSQVVVIGWDGWGNQEVVGAVDLMTYCWGSCWMSPTRWRRLFMGVGL